MRVGEQLLARYRPSSIRSALFLRALQLLHLRRHDLGDRSAAASIAEEPPDQMATDQDLVTLAEALAGLSGRPFPGGYREGEDALAGFRYVEAEPGHRVTGWHLLDLRHVREPA